MEQNKAQCWLCVLTLAGLIAMCGVAIASEPPHPPQDAAGVKYGTNALGMDFVAVPAGEFTMGCSAEPPSEKLPFPTGCGKQEKPAHVVQITKPFEIQKTELTQKQWQAVMGSGNNPSAHKGEDLPVEQVTFPQVQDYITKLNAKGNDGYAYRLPTEAEWEYAARAGTKDPYAGPIHESAWYNDGQAAARGTGSFQNTNSPDGFAVATTHPGATKNANAWGIYDMRGNVQEWVQDWYDPTYYAKSPAADPQGPSSGDGRVVRGGSYHVYPWLTTVSVRAYFPEEYEFNDVGFRLVRVKK
jgi:formylglycine-generating enzyme required for sulfatase activity